MAFVSVAGKWLLSNDSEAIRKRSRDRKRAAARMATGYKEVVHFQVDRAAFDLKKKNEGQRLGPRAEGERRGKPLPPYTPQEFVKDHVRFDGNHCLFVPFSRPHARVAASLNGEVFSAAALMCRLAHGHGGEGQVARHLCGNGHLSCVNPKHLRWGSADQNARDTWLHTARPSEWPDICEATRKAIAESDAHPNALAVDLDIPTSIILLVQSGRF